MSGIKLLMSKLKDYNLRCEDCVDSDDYILEECDTKYDLFYQIEIIIYNNSIKKIEDFQNESYLKDLKQYYIINKSGLKISLDQFVPFVYSDNINNEWRMIGDNKFID